MENLALQKCNEANAKLQLDIIDFNTVGFEAVFYVAESLVEVCSVFGPLSEELAKKKKYAKLCTAVGGILNGFAPSDFQLAAIQALKIDTEEEMATVVKLIYVKAIADPISSPIYAKMCLALSTKEVPSASDPAVITNFRKVLLLECQKRFEEDYFSRQDTKDEKEEIESAEKETEKKDFEIGFKKDPLNRRRSLGNIRFIGQLIKLRILSEKILHQCILRLLSQRDDEDYLEALCVLLITTGKNMESAKTPQMSVTETNREIMNSYFTTLEAIVKNQTVSERILSMIQEVIDLRKCGWSITAAHRV
ncbi:eukaryotic translation initiation factor 4 gamma 1-like [Daphnia pulicaria]|uniref:eukaryotic translation initiation factor 4 gamma 1-like n=1 Tax=Daphnia pulicaria TaxID=35523 RepID=UPI001EE9EE18|nr:eukaryotic translation initiation factor 4 gamma 1-like [Daphnia pulicaria]